MAKLLRELHADGTLVLPNAWDAASAAVIADAGAAAVATTSAGVAWSLGRPDGELLPRAELVAAMERMAAAIDVPLTADVEAGYGATEDEVAETVTDVYMRRIGDPQTRLDEVLRRGAEYAEAGGDCLFVPGLADLAVLESLVARSPLPIG